MAFYEEKIGDYIDALSSKDPVPGGGGVSALCGALACGLSRMVCSLTLGKKKYADVEADITAYADMLAAATERLYDLMEEDAEAFLPLSRAYSMPADDEESRLEKQRVMETCLVNASTPPMQICRHIEGLARTVTEIARKGSVLAVSDAGCSAALFEAAFKAAKLNVLINTRLMKDRDRAEMINSELEDLERSALDAFAAVYAEVSERLSAAR